MCLCPSAATNIAMVESASLSVKMESIIELVYCCSRWGLWSVMAIATAYYLHLLFLSVNHLSSHYIKLYVLSFSFLSSLAPSFLLSSHPSTQNWGWLLLLCCGHCVSPYFADNYCLMTSMFLPVKHLTELNWVKTTTTLIHIYIYLSTCTYLQWHIGFILHRSSGPSHITHCCIGRHVSTISISL